MCEYDTDAPAILTTRGHPHKETSILQKKKCYFFFVCVEVLFVLRFYGPVNPMAWVELATSYSPARRSCNWATKAS